eukprot:139809_1
MEKLYFHFFIYDAEKYVLSISKILVPSDTKKQKLYYDIVIYKVLAQLCGCSVSLHEQAKKAPFFCKNSVERKGRLKEILQKYAADHEYIQGFPSCFEEAIGFFDKKSNNYFHQFRRLYMGYNNYDDNDDDDDGDSSISDDNKRRNSKSSKMTKREPGLGRQATSREAEYWKNQTLKLQQQIDTEKRLRIQAEVERDTLRSIINSQNGNNNKHVVHSQCNCESPESNHHLGLINDSSLNSSNGSTASTSTLSMTYNNMPSLQQSGSYHSNASSHHTASSHHSSHHSIPNSYHQQQQHQQQQQQQQHRMNNNNNNPASSSSHNLLPPIIGYVPNNSSLQINHSPHHFNQNYVPFVNNCNNNSNVFIHSDRNNVSDIYGNNNNNNVLSQHFSSHPPLQQVTTTNSNQTATNLNQTPSNNDNSYEFESFASVMPTISTMPIMNRLQQISDDSFGEYNTNNNANSPAPLYSFTNAVLSNNDHF